jgi:hypothetical protein
MWSTVVMFVLTFAILGLLLGFAEIYDPSQGAEEESTSQQSDSTMNTTATLVMETTPEMSSG